MSYLNQSTSERLFFFREAITVVQSDVEVADTLAAYGFDNVRMDTARELYDRTYAAVTERQERFSEQLLATDRMYDAQAVFTTLFRNDRNMVRSVLQKKRSEWERFFKLRGALDYAPVARIAARMSLVFMCFSCSSV